MGVMDPMPASADASDGDPEALVGASS